MSRDLVTQGRSLAVWHIQRMCLYAREADGIKAYSTWRYRARVALMAALLVGSFLLLLMAAGCEAGPRPVRSSEGVIYGVTTCVDMQCDDVAIDAK